MLIILMMTRLDRFLNRLKFDTLTGHSSDEDERISRADWQSLRQLPHLNFHISTSTSQLPHLNFHISTSTSQLPHLNFHISTSTTSSHNTLAAPPKLQRPTTSCPAS